MIYLENYKSSLDLLHTEVAIKLVKDTFERALSSNLRLTRVSAPLIVYEDTGLNDNLNGTEQAISFKAKTLGDRDIDIVHSLAKWKRMALKNYGLKRFKGIYTDMNALRKDEEEVDNLHSIYVDQWDWEKVIEAEDRTLDFLYGTVDRIVEAMRETQHKVLENYHDLQPVIPETDCFYITTTELYNMYPDLTPKEREYEICKEKKLVFISQIGDILPDGKKHDGRSPDYDDWSLNGDILIWYDILGCQVELSSMGIRVDKKSFQQQLAIAGCMERLQLPFHQALLNDELPLTMGGGIGQSRLCMVLLNKAHVGEVQASLWPKEMIEKCHQCNIELL